MAFYIVLSPLVPLRSDASERSEMVTQLLFGELVEEVEQRPLWIKVKNRADGYSGWADRKMLTSLSAEEYYTALSAPFRILTAPLTRVLLSDETSVWLPMGSTLRGWNETLRQASLNGYTFRGIPGEIPTSPMEAACALLNAPYLWGGKSVLGIDCSGLVQLAHAVTGLQLPRDASQQIGCGRPLTEEDIPAVGDLAFFQNEEGRIVHVGLMIDSLHLIHASGKVRIDPLNDCGHRFHSLRRL